jgi:acetyl-CoA carboxylase biotin carboxyl carrier protein
MKKDIPPKSSERLEVPEKAIRKLSELLKASDLSEIEICEGDFKLRVRAREMAVESAPVFVSNRAASPTVVAKAEASSDGDLHIVRSPFVGTYYKAASPESEAFVREGQAVSKGQVMCIVEAMKVLNEIECEVSGVVEKIYAENALPVDYNAPLFGIRTSS